MPKLRQEDSCRDREKREEEGAERDRRWHWQTKHYDPAAPKISLKDLKAGITAGNRGRGYFSHLQRETESKGQSRRKSVCTFVLIIRTEKKEKM